MTEEKHKNKAKGTVFIAGKPIMNYVTSTVMQFNADEVKVRLRARGKFISRAVDVAEMVTRRFLKDKCAYEEIKVNSETFTNKEGKEVRVSTIEIILLKVI